MMRGSAKRNNCSSHLVFYSIQSENSNGGRPAKKYSVRSDGAFPVLLNSVLRLTGRRGVCAQRICTYLLYSVLVDMIWRLLAQVYPKPWVSATWSQKKKKRKRQTTVACPWERKVDIRLSNERNVIQVAKVAHHTNQLASPAIASES